VSNDGGLTDEVCRALMEQHSERLARQEAREESDRERLRELRLQDEFRDRVSTMNGYDPRWKVGP
jgi:hypothetical protein